MTTIAELLDSLPEPTDGYAIANREADDGVWRFGVWIADPLAGESIVRHDITGFYAGDHHERGAIEYGGRCQPATTAVTLVADDDSLAPWGQDTSALFGVDIELDAGLIMQAAWFRVVAGVTVEWEPVWTGRVEDWGDNTGALGHIRTHNVVVVDTIGDLVDVPVPSMGGAQPFDERIGGEFGILEFASWPFGVDIYGDPEAVPDLPIRDEQASARVELAASVDPLGLVERTRRNGRLVVHPAPFDTLHGVTWPNPTTAAYPDGIVFSYNPDLNDVAYVVDDRITSFGIARNSTAVINNIVANMPGGAYPVDDPVSASRYGQKGKSLTWIVDNGDAVDQLLAARAYATKQALPLTTRDDLPGFFPAMTLIDHLDPITVVHANRSDGLVVTGTGTVRRVTEDRHLLYETSTGARVLEQTSVVQMDIVDTTVSEPLLPVENLALSSLQTNYAVFGWTNPVQPFVEPTDTQIRVQGYSLIWLDHPYPITTAQTGVLQPSTQYQVDVRLVRKVNGIITHASAVRSFTFTSRPPFVPDLGPGDNGDETDVDIPPGDEECDLEWEIQENDGTGWSTFMSGDQDDLVLGDDGLYHLPTPIDNEDFDPDKLYRVRYREVCGGVPGDWVTGPATDPPDDWDDPCVTPPALSDEPFNDPDLLVYVPKVCAPNVITEAVSGLAGVHGAAFGDLLQSVDEPDRLALQAVAQPAWDAAPGGIIAYGECPQIDGETGDKTIACKVSIADDTETVVLFECAAMQLKCVAVGGGGWRASVVLYKPDGTTSLPGDSVLDPDTEYHLAATFDLETGDLNLYVDAVLDNSVAGTDNVATINALPIWRVGAPPGSWVTDCAVWSKVIAPAWTPTFLGGELLVWWDFTDTSSMTLTGSTIDTVQDKSSTSGNVTLSKTGTPQLATNVINGLPVARFDGVDDAFHANSAFLFNNVGIEIWIVAKSDESGTGTLISEGNATSGGQVYRVYDDDPANAYVFQYTNVSNVDRFVNSQSRSINAWDLIIATDKGAAVGTNVEVVDVDAGSTGAYTRDGGTWNRLAVGVSWRSQPHTLWFDGDIAEILIINSALSAPNRALLTDYLNAKYAKTWTPV